MKNSQFVKELRSEIKTHILKWQSKLDHQAENIDFDEFVSSLSRKANKKELPIYTKAREIKAQHVIEMSIDGAFFRILDKPTSLAYVYKHAARAV